MTRRLVALALLVGLLVAPMVAWPTVICTPLGSLTTVLQLCKPSTGEIGWDAAINNNFTVLDALFNGTLSQRFAGIGLNTTAPAGGNLAMGGIVSSYNGNASANAGVPFQLGAVNLTGQTGAIGATTIFTPAASGLYRATYYVVVTSTGTSVNLVLNILSTDDAAARTQAASTVSCAATNFTQGVFIVRAFSTNPIQYNTTIAGTCTYSVFVALERLS